MKHLFLSFLVLLTSFHFSFGQSEPPSDLDGTDLQTWLKANWYDGKFTDKGYDGARIAMYSIIDRQADGQVYCVYSGFSQPAESTTFLDPINPEHTIPQSIGAGSSPMRSDIIHLFPTHGTVNGVRGSSPFGDIPDSETDKWHGVSSSNQYVSQTSIPSSNIDDYSESINDTFEPREGHKGDLARAVFYFFTVYNSATIDQVGDVTVLYQWHQDDPVDDWERTRNDRIETAQGNRNPYVDYPDLVCRAWGTECSTSGGGSGGGATAGAELIITGVFDGPLSGGTPKGVELFAASNIADLSIYGLNAATNGAGTSGTPPFELSGSALAGDYIYVSSEIDGFTAFFGFSPTMTSGEMSINGDDAIELYKDENGWKVIDVFGDVDQDGTGTAWDHLDGWVYRKDDSGPNEGVFLESNWTYSGVDVFDGQTSNGTAAIPFPIGTYTRSESCTAPASQASGLTADNIADQSISLSWTRGDGDQVIVVGRNSGATAATPEIGTEYQWDAAFGSGDEIGSGNFVLYVGDASSVVITALVSGTSYDFVAYEFTNTSLCYLVDSPASLTASTTTSNDQDSEVEAPSEQIAAIAIPSIATTAADALPVFKFQISDKGTSDALPTIISEVHIAAGAENGVDWSTVLAGASLSNGTTTMDATTIESTEISFILSTPLEVASSSTQEFTLSVWLDTVVIDNSLLQFQIADPHKFVASGRGSLLQSNLDSTILSAVHTIAVEGTELRTQIPSSARLNADFTARVEATDTYGNTDLKERSFTLSLVSGSVLSSATGLDNRTSVDGAFTWTDLRIATAGEYEISITDSELTSPFSNINIFEITEGLFFSEYIEGSGSNKAIELYNASNATLDLSQYTIERYNNGVTTTPFVMNLSDVQADLAPAGIIVIANPSADQSILALASTTGEITFYNGDDVLLLKQGTEIIDVFGNLGEDPGSNWQVGSTGATSEFTLVRKSNVVAGNTTPLGSFGTSDDDSEWIVLPQNDFSNLGSHTIDDFSCTPPTTQVSALAASDVTEVQLSLSWVRGNGDQVIVIGRKAAAVTVELNEGDQFTADATFSNGQEIGVGNYVLYVGDASSLTVTGLEQGTTYHFAAYELGSDPNCYTTESPATISATTVTPNDTDSEVLSPSEQIIASTISSISNTSSASVEVFKFMIADKATSDDLSTFVKSVVITSAGSNTALWSETIGGAYLSSGTIQTSASTIVGNRLLFEYEDAVEIASGTSGEFSLAIWLDTTVLDEIVLAFQIETTHELITDSRGSLLVQPLANAVASELHTINVNATKLELESAGSVNLSKPFLMKVTATDAAGNIDISAGKVSINVSTGTGQLNSVIGIMDQDLVNGVFEWTDLTYTVAETATLQVTLGDLTNTKEVSFFTISDNLIFSEYVEGSAFNKAIEIFNTSEAPIALENYSIVRYQNGSPTPSSTLVLSSIQTSIAGKEHLVIAHPSADAGLIDLADITDGIVDFNGDDAMALLGDGELLDLIGEIGNDPGTRWSVGAEGSTVDHTLTRRSTILSGNTTPLGSFGTDDTSSEWIVLDIDDFSNLGKITEEKPIEPVLELDVIGFVNDFVETEVGQSSSTQTFAIAANNLTGDVSVMTTASFEVSEDNVTFTSSLNFTPTTGALSTTVYVRFTPTEEKTFDGSITVATDGLDDQVLAVSGTGIVLRPILTVNSDRLTGIFGEIETGTVSTSESIEVVGSLLLGDVSITIPEAFELADSEDFLNPQSESIVLSPVDGSVRSVFFVRFAPKEDGVYEEVLTISTTEADPIELDLSGSSFTPQGPQVLANNQRAFGFYPNPVSDYLSFENLPSQEIITRVISLDGRLMTIKHLQKGQQLDVKELAGGLYILELESQGKVQRFKLIVE